MPESTINWLLSVALAISLAHLAGAQPYPQSNDVELLRAESGPDVRLIVRNSYLPGIPVLVRVQVLDDKGMVDRRLWDAVAILSVPDNPSIHLSTEHVTLYNGLGSALVSIVGSGDFTLTVEVNGFQTTTTLIDWSARPIHKVSGRLARSQTWSGIYHVTGGDFRIPAGIVLTLNPGTLVLIDGVPSGTNGTDIDVAGAIESLGTPASPVTFTAYTPGENWGELHHDDAEPSTFQYTNITGAGHSPRVGHSNSGPTIRASGSTFVFEHCSLTDNAGKLMHTTSGCDLTFRHCLFARSIMGPEISGTALWFEKSWITDMHSVDDADGIYVHGQRAGQRCMMLHGVVANIDDDGIDTLGSDITIEDFFVRDCRDKGISIYNGEVDIHRCLIVENNKAPEDPTIATIATKTVNGATAIVNIDRTTIVTWKTPSYLDVGVQTHNKYGVTSGTITYNITNSIIDATDPVDVQAPYTESDVHIHYSDVFGETWPGTGNLNTDPLFVDRANHDYRLRENSPCIDAGDPGTDPDPDLSIADQGYSWFEIESSELPGQSLTEDTVWIAEEGPYRLIGDLTILSGTTLTIMPGTTVWFDPDAKMVINGCLVAKGTEDELIHFTRTPAVGYTWGGLQFVDSMDDNLIAHAIVEYGRTSDGMIEGNIFMNYIKDEYNKASGESNGLSAGSGRHFVMARNIFHDIQHVAQVKDDSFLTFVNNTVVRTSGASVYFDLGLPGRGPGRGAYLDGNIFWDTPLVFEGVVSATDLAVHRSILPSEWHSLGEGNIDADPLFVDQSSDFHLKPDSPAIGAGPCGLDMGAYVPSGAALCGEPEELTHRTDATLIVGGPGITHYKYRLNSKPWSVERPVEVPIELSNLLNGQSYTIYAIGKNSAGSWQSEGNPTVSRTWTIDTSYSK